jgi:hypothetical protein
MAKYIKKPIPVEAVQMMEEFEVETLEGVMKGHAGDYLCIDHRGNKYPCYKLVFEEIYDLVDEF